jgi:high-affinity iron transporter
MNRPSFSCLLLCVMLAGAAMMPPRFFPSSANQLEAAPAANGPENGQRWVFTLQYLAGDYDRAVQNGRIVDSLEYNEMQRFAKNLLTAYQSSRGARKPTLQELQKLERLIAEKAALQQIRALCRGLIAVFIKEKNLLVFPRVGPELANGKRLFEENCVSCHGPRGAGDGPSADTLNPKPRDFTDPERLNHYAPYQFFQAVSFGVEGTAMASFGEAFTHEEIWDIAFYLMTLRRDFHAPESAEQKLTLQQLATKNNEELLTLLAQQNRQKTAPDFKALVDYCRQNPPQPTAEEYIAITEKLLNQSFAAYVRGDSALANHYAYDAYWQGFETIERRLQFPLYRRFEIILGDYNVCIETPGQHQKARRHIKMMLEILQHIRKGKGWRS